MKITLSGKGFFIYCIVDLAMVTSGLTKIPFSDKAVFIYSVDDFNLIVSDDQIVITSGNAK